MRIPTIDLRVAALLYCITLSTCSILLSGGTIISFDDATSCLRIIENGSLLITDDRITSIFDTSTPPNIPPGTEIIDCINKIISPGFVDTHRHGWQTVFKTLGSNTTLAEYLLRYGSGVAAPLFSPDDLYISQLTGIYEALNAGVTTILDHAHHTWTPEHAAMGLKASADSGARVFFGYAFQNSSADFGVPEQIAQWKNLKSSFESNTTDLVIAYDDWSGNPAGENTRAVIDLINTSNVSVLTTHSLEGPWLFGNTPTTLATLNILNTTTATIMSHASYLTPRDALLLRTYNKHISITPESEMHHGFLHPTSHLILDQASLGVDTHFTFSTDILSQARLWLQTTRALIYQSVADRWEIPSKSPFSVTQAFLLATRNGGLALGRPDLGVISVGAKADLVIFDGRSPALLGWRDAVAAVILHAGVGDMESVLVDGEFVKREGKLVVDGYEGVKTRFLEAAGRIQDVLEKTPLPAQEGSVIPGYTYGYIPQADVVRGEGTGY
ncbi:Metallo-dependent hydrolase [Glarea lozoyensis ATCC 20868]|uniref:Metallo-dependent hydrolase n=1 Tax=Glarea lozoyensis (strain ATCC 20868 / MF5171) TaxID=1116229 RepID=S3CX43_GLAL2|nr:Metallo-dependent hydrolase [Glarea lozoyensis ATCC 20868]EPE30917.1 Metallo-dependent hydrolase [Glarea lozoyensis ATCC 20868]